MTSVEELLAYRRDLDVEMEKLYKSYGFKPVKKQVEGIREIRSLEMLEQKLEDTRRSNRELLVKYKYLLFGASTAGADKIIEFLMTFKDKSLESEVEFYHKLLKYGYNIFERRQVNPKYKDDEEIQRLEQELEDQRRKNIELLLLLNSLVFGASPTGLKFIVGFLR